MAAMPSALVVSAMKTLAVEAELCGWQTYEGRMFGSHRAQLREVDWLYVLTQGDEGNSLVIGQRAMLSKTTVVLGIVSHSHTR